MSDLKFTSAQEYMDTSGGQDSSRSVVIALGNQLGEMRACGKIDTEEYKVLSDERDAAMFELWLSQLY